LWPKNITKVNEFHKLESELSKNFPLNWKLKRRDPNIFPCSMALNAEQKPKE
jgi:hypothetical protein